MQINFSDVISQSLKSIPIYILYTEYILFIFKYNICPFIYLLSFWFTNVQKKKNIKKGPIRKYKTYYFTVYRQKEIYKRDMCIVCSLYKYDYNILYIYCIYL